ncbi:transport and Golgi organization protein 1 homolog [Tupaia chinensis]|uniref:transport and Golgi organization protein 1 homolog n=1 Tax=Tupaia chinensis TaxID=246437 RepID=UPI0003C8C4BA|nr:transport and Golgi organization protein 1 homolog [Tupaia chinensis]
MEKKMELLMAQAYLKFASKEVQKLKERIAEMQDEMQRKETSFQKQMAIYKKKAQENWLRAHTGERAEAKQISETNFLNRRWPIMQSQRMPQEPRL